jgi:hypothetical protein
MTQDALTDLVYTLRDEKIICPACAWYGYFVSDYNIVRQLRQIENNDDGFGDDKNSFYGRLISHPMSYGHLQETFLQDGTQACKQSSKNSETRPSNNSVSQGICLVFSFSGGLPLGLLFTFPTGTVKAL